MTSDDRIMLAKCFVFSLKILFAILYAATDRVDRNLWSDYEKLVGDLNRWYSPTTLPTPTKKAD